MYKGVIRSSIRQEGVDETPIRSVHSQRRQTAKSKSPKSIFFAIYWIVDEMNSCEAADGEEWLVPKDFMAIVKRCMMT